MSGGDDWMGMTGSASTLRELIHGPLSKCSPGEIIVHPATWAVLLAAYPPRWPDPPVDREQIRRAVRRCWPGYYETWEDFLD